MRIAQISSGGQIQIPAEVRKRWGTRKVIVDDAGGYLRITPVPDDPIAAVAGSLKGPGPSAAEMIRKLREEEATAESRKWRRLERRS
jgi:bifunctional DNA-binding transcriptional regulator/antitoxin component of YhaV-PrlF toxin-antitoxin module